MIARPILYGSPAGDAVLNAMVADIRIAKQYGLDGFLVDELWDGDDGSGANYRNMWRKLLKAAEIAGGFKIGLMPDYACLKTATLHAAGCRSRPGWTSASNRPQC